MPKKKPAVYRVRFEIDAEAQFEECNGEARPLTEEEYKGNEYRACPDHPHAGTQVLDLGGDGRPQIQGCAVCKRTDYQDISYEEYRAYYGNPDRHVYLGCEVEQQCPCCHEWAFGASLWRIDLMDDSPEMTALDAGRLGKWLPEAEALTLPGYLADVAKELLDEAKP